MGGRAVPTVRAVVWDVAMMHEEVQCMIRRESDLMIERWFSRLVGEYGLLNREAYRILQAAFDAGLKDVRDSYPNKGA